MVQKKNNFATGPHGTGITAANSDDVPGNDSLTGGNLSVGATKTYYDASLLDRNTAQFVMKASVPAGLGSANVGWDDVAWGTSSNQVWTRFYCYLPALPIATQRTSLVQIWSFDDINGVYFVNFNMGVATDSANELFVWESDPATQIVLGSNPVATNQWVRFEIRAQFSTTSTANGELLYFEQADAPLTDYTDSITWSGWDDNGANANQALFGYTTPASSAGAVTIYYSGLEINSTGWIGPAPFRAGKGVPGILTSPVAIHTDVR